MNKKVKGIVAGGGVLVLLVGALVALKYTGSNDSSSELDSLVTAETKTIASEWSSRFGEDSEYTEDNIKSVAVSNGNGSYEVVRTGTDTETSESDSTGNVSYTYGITGLENYKMNSSLINSMPNTALTAVLPKVIEENSDNLAKYGLDNPLSEVTVNLDDGKQIIYEIGNVSPVSTETYLCFKGDSTVYTINASSTNAFLGGKEYYVSLVLVDEIPDDEKLQKLKIDKSDLDYDIVYEYNVNSESYKEGAGTSSYYVMTEPIYSYMDAEKSNDYFKNISGLTASSVAMLDADADALSIAGLDNPYCTMEIEVSDGSSYTLKLSKAPGDTTGYYLAYIEGNSAIYLVSESSLPWVTSDISFGTSSLIFAYYVYNIGKVDVDVSGKDKMVFECSGSEEDDYEVTLNGEECDTERYRAFYSFLLKTPAEEIYMGEVTGDPIAKITVETQNDMKTDVEFYESNDRKVIMKVNGKVSFKCRSSFIDTLKSNIDKFGTGEEFSNEW